MTESYIIIVELRQDSIESNEVSCTIKLWYFIVR